MLLASPSVAAIGVTPINGTALLQLAAIDDGNQDRGFLNDDTVQFSALVSRIQEVLKQLGIYGGPVDGVFASTTERAIRIYQNQVDLPITGQPSRDLLDHLETVGRANRLLGRLGESRDREQERARELIAASTFAARLSSDETATANPIRDPAPCFAKPTARCLLDEAMESAKAVADTKFRDWALGDVAVARASAGLEDEVYRTISLIEDPRLVIAALRDAGVAWANADKKGHAREIAAELKDAVAAAEVTAALALAEARDGDAATLGRTLGALMMYASGSDDASTMARLLTRVAPQLQDAGAIRAARDVIEAALQAADDAQLGDQERDRLRGEIGAVFAALGDTEQARALLQSIENEAAQRPILVALAEESVSKGNAEAAIEAATKVHDHRYRVVALTDIAIAHARAGNVDAARRSIVQARADTEEIDKRYTYARAFAVSRIAAALAEIRGYDDAITAAGTIEDEGLRAQSLWHLAALQAQDSALASQKTRSMALATADSIASELDRAWTLARLALSSARHGEWELADDTMQAAIEAGSQIDNSFARASALTKLASTLLLLGELEAQR